MFIVLHDVNEGSSILINTNKLETAYFDGSIRATVVVVGENSFRVKEHVDSIKRLIDLNNEKRS